MSKNRSTTILGAFPSIYRLPVDDAGSRLYRVDNERESIGQVIAWPTVKAHPPIRFAGYNPEAVMLDFMQPVSARRRLRG
jgi:hypothetical protein